MPEQKQAGVSIAGSGKFVCKKRQTKLLGFRRFFFQFLACRRFSAGTLLRGALLFGLLDGGGFDGFLSMLGRGGCSRGAFGFDILNAYRMKYETLAWLSSYNVPKSAYSKIGDYYNFASAIYSDRYIEKGDYVKLDNVTVGYTFDLSGINNVVRKLRVYATGMNLLTLTGYSGTDPEVPITGLTPGIDPVDKYPHLRSFIFGVSVEF